MPDVITRLKVESKEYDAKIDRARSGLLHMEEACRKVGGTLAVLEKDEKDFVAALGNMETVSKTARGKLNELTKAFTDLSVQYSRLTDEEKKGDFGKALSQSLETLKGRIQNARTELSGVSAQLGETKNESNSLKDALSKIAGQFGINTTQLTKMGVALAAVKGAQEAFERIIAGSQTATDEYGRSLEACTRVTDGLFESISRGNFASFIAGLQDVITNARNAYDALDSLATFNAFNSKEVSEFEARRSKLRANIRQGVDVEASKKALKELENEEQKYYKEAAKLNKDAGVAKLIELTGSKAGSNWITPYLNMGAGGQEAAAKAAEQLKAQFFKAENFNITDYYQKNAGGRAGDSLGGWATEEAKKQYNALVNYAQLSDEQLAEINQYYAASNNALSQMWGKVASDARLMNANGNVSGGTGGSTTQVTPKPEPVVVPVEFAPLDFSTIKTGLNDSIADLEKIKATWNEVFNNAGDPLTLLNAKQQIEEIDAKIKALKDNNPFQIQGPTFDDIQLPQELKDLPNIGAMTTSSWKDASKAIAAVGGAMQQIQNPAAKVAGIIAQAVATMALSYSQAASSPAVTSTGWGWLGFAATGLATMISSIEGIKQATQGFAEGGIVGGQMFQGDNNYVRANSGEMFINQTDQRKLYNAIHGDSLSVNGGTTQSVVRGSDIYLSLRSYMRSTGKTL